MGGWGGGWGEEKEECVQLPVTYTNTPYAMTYKGGLCLVAIYFTVHP